MEKYRKEDENKGGETESSSRVTYYRWGREPDHGLAIELQPRGPGGETLL